MKLNITFDKRFLTQNVNMIISVLFIVSFGAVATSAILRASSMDDPLTGTLAAHMAAIEAAQE
jgi:hypothetical protein